MNVFNKIALQGLKKNRTRTLVTIIGVVLSAAMVTAVVTFGVSLLNYMADGAIRKYGDWHAAFLDVNPSFVQERTMDQDIINAVSFENIGYVSLDAGKNPKKPYLFIAGFNQEAFELIPVTLLSGRLPKNSGEILVSSKAAADSGISCVLGNTVTFDVGSRMNEEQPLGQGDSYLSEGETFVPLETRSYKVVGICATPVFEENTSPGYTLITGSETSSTGNSLSLFVTLKNIRKVHAYADSRADGHAYILNHDVLRIMGLSDDPADRIFSALLYSIGLIVIAIIMTGSVFLIYNSFHISLNERMQQFGILSSVGATAKQLRGSVLFEGLCIGAAGIPIGILTGLLSIFLVISISAGNFGSIFNTDVPLTLKVSFPAIAGAVFVSLTTILISAYLPAKKAAGMPVMDCIRQTNEVKAGAGAFKTSKLSNRIYGLEGILALKNFKRNKKRYRSIVLSLVLSIVLFLSTSALVTDLKQMSEQAGVVTDYDIGFGTQDMEDSELIRIYEMLKNTRGVYESSFQEVMEYTCTVKTDELSNEFKEFMGTGAKDLTVDLPVQIQFLDDNAYLRMIGKSGLPEKTYSGRSEQLIAVAKLEDNSREAKNVNSLPDLFANSTLTITVTPNTKEGPEEEKKQTLNITCVEIVPPDTPPATDSLTKQPYSFQIIAPWSLKEKLAPFHNREDCIVKGLTFLSRNSTESADLMKTRLADAGITSPYLIMNTSEMLNESRSTIFVANMFAYTFIILISLIAVANVFNTISTNIKLRKREFAMLRSIGMSDRDFNKMMRFECVFYGVRALFIGLPAGMAFSCLIHFKMVSDSIAFKLPWGSIIISILSVLLIIFITMAYAVSKIKKENIIDALRDEMT